MSNELRIALVGNPNTGKSSLFNALTGLRQKVGNFPGVTVEKSVGSFSLPDGKKAEILDLPGAYSLFAKSPDEAIPFNIVFDEKHPHHPDLVVYIADASNLKRNMVLLTQLIDLKLPLVVALNMMDIAEKQGAKIDSHCLADKLGVPVVPIVARKRTGIDKLLQQIQQGGKVSEKIFTPDAAAFQESLFQHSSRWSGLNEPPSASVKVRSVSPQVAVSHFSQRDDLLYRYKSIKQILGSCVTVTHDTRFKKVQHRLDAVLTHKVGGYFIFFAILFLIFQAIFNLAEYPMTLIENGFSALSALVTEIMPKGVLNDLITKGILAGLSGVVVFIPQIAFLFLFITVLEDTGYLSRVAFLMDRSMRRLGLNGKSVIPLISGTACAVPAILATRNIESRKSRLITILVTPLMSCSARLPVYILLIGLIVPDNHRVLGGLLNMQGAALMGMYVVGFLAVIGAAMVFKVFLKTKEKQYFVFELPVYRLPNWHNIWLTVYKKVKTFIKEAGKIIIAISIILWFLASFGPKPTTSAAVTETPNQKLENSYAGKLGRFIEPAIAPLGYDWKIGISIITSFAAREVFVGTMSTLYGLESRSGGTDFSELKERMSEAKDPATGKPVYSFATVLSLLFFYAFALQCMSTIAVTYKETASLKWTLIQFIFMGSLAYITSFIVYHWAVLF